MRCNSARRASFANHLRLLYVIYWNSPRSLSSAAVAMAVLDSCCRRLAAARSPVELPHRTAPAAAAASSTVATRTTAVTSAAAVARVAVTPAVPPAAPAAATAARAAAREAPGAAKAVSAFPPAAGEGPADARAERGCATTAASPAAGLQTPETRPAAPPSAFVSCWLSALFAGRSVAGGPWFCSSLQPTPVAYFFRPQLAAGGASSTKMLTPCRMRSASTAGFATAAAATSLGAAAVPLATFVCTSHFRGRHAGVPSLVTSAAAAASPSSFLRTTAAPGKTEAANVDFRLSCAATEKKETAAGCATLQHPVAERRSKAAEEEGSTSSAEVREQLGFNKRLAFFGATVMEQTAISRNLRPARTAAAWPFNVRLSQKDVFIALLHTASFDRGSSNTSCSSTSHTSSSIDSSKSCRNSHTSCRNGNTNRTTRGSCSGNTSSNADGEHETRTLTCSGTGSGRCSSVNGRSASAPDSHRAHSTGLDGENGAGERSSSATTSSSSTTYGFPNRLGSGRTSSSTDSCSRRCCRSYGTCASKNSDDKKDSSSCSSASSQNSGIDWGAAACALSYVVEKRCTCASQCRQLVCLLGLPSRIPGAARTALSVGKKLAACTAVAYTAAPVVSSSRAAGAISPAAIVPPGAVVCRAAATVSPDEIDSSASRGSWMIFILTPLAAFLAAASEVQRRRRVAACEATSPAPSSAQNTSSSSNSASSPSPAITSVFAGWLPSRLLRLKGAGSAHTRAELQQPLQQEQVLQQQDPLHQEHTPQQQPQQVTQPQHLFSSGERLSSSSDRRLFSSSVVGQNSSFGSSSSSAGGDAGTAVGGPQLRWRGGAVGSCAEAANAPLEDRSFAVVLPLDVSTEAVFPSRNAYSERVGRSSIDGSSSSYGSMPVEIGEPTEPRVVEDLLAKAALVFPEEIRRRQQKDDSWRSLRLPPRPRVESTSASLSSLYPHLTAGRSEPAGISAVKKGRDNSTTAETRGLLEDSSNACLLAAVIDGHGGPQVAEYVRQHLPHYVHRELLRATEAAGVPRTGSRRDAHLTDSALETAVTQAFRSLDDEIFDSVRAAYALSLTRSIRVGACCTAILLVEDKLLVANSGDCKAILSRRGGNEVLALNEQLNANSLSERQRLRKEHPGEENVVVCKHSWVEHRKPSSPIEVPLYYAGLLGKTTHYSACYVKGRLQPTRAFGDFLLKKPEYAHEMRQRSSRRSSTNKSNVEEQQQLSYPYLTVDPVVSTAELRGDEDFIVLGSDGVWDFLSDADVNRIVHASLDRTKQRATLNTAVEQPATRVRSTGEKEDTAVNAIEAARTAAADIVRAVLQKAADEHNMTTEEMKACDPKRRRHFFDDVTAVVVLLGNEWRAGDTVIPRSKL